MSDWSIEKFGFQLDLQSISKRVLNNHLRLFYTEVQRKPDFNGKKENKMSNEYHKNTLKAIGSAIDCLLSDIGRDMDIVQDKAFK